jgi:hypothetical protein
MRTNVELKVARSEAILKSQARGILAFRHLFDVSSCTEGATFSCQNDDLHIWIRFGLFQCLADAVHHFRRKGIFCLRPVHGD